MKIAFNPSTVEALITPPNNKDITFDLRGQNIFARGVKFCGTDTNTWRDIKINNVSIGSNILDLRDGDNTTLTNINGVVTINSTWRPVVDNLTSDSTTSSLSANQGRILAELINGKSDSGHNHDDRYLRLTGGWMSGDINFGGDNRIYWGRNTDSASISFKNDGDGDADSYMSFVTSDNGNEYFRWSHSSGSTNTEWMSLRSDGLRVGGTKVSLEGHSHNDLYYTKAEVNNKLNGKSDTSHTHDDRYLKLTGGTMLLGEGLKFHADDNYFGTYSDARIISLLDNNDKVCDGGLIIDERATYNGTEYVTELLRIRDSEFKWKGSNILHSGNSHINENTITINGSSLTVSKSDHTHAYLPLAGGTMTGSIKFNQNSLPQKTLYYVCGIDAFADGGEMGWMRGSDFVVQYAPTKTGLGASGTWDINISGNATTANTAIVWKRTWERSHDCLVDIPSSETRVYMADSQTANKPCSGAGFIIGHGWDWGYGGAMIYQDFDGNDGGRLYTNSRQCDGAWQGWNKVAFVKEIPTVTDYYWANVKVSASSSTSTSPTFNTCYTNNWYRSTGQTGWYNESYEGGINMVDSTWVRIYNNKKFYVSNSEYDAIHSAGGVYVAGMIHSYANYLKSTCNGAYVQIGPQNNSHAHYETNASISHWFNKRIDVNGAIWRYGTNYGIDSDGRFYTKSVYANRDGSLTDGGVSLYSNVDPMTYGIAFRGTGTYGTHGYVTSANDWATYLTMNDNTTRGWIFRRGDTNVASIAGSGNMAIGQHLEFSNGAHISTNRSTDYHYGYTFNLGDNAKSIGMYSGPSGEAGGVVISPDGCLIYNSSDCGYNLQVRDKDLGSDLTNIATLTFGIEQSGYYAWSLGGFKKNGSSDFYVLLGGGGHQTISSLSVNYANSAGNADTVDGYHATSGNNKPWGTIPVITTNGYMDIGKHLEFHYDNSTGSDYSTALMCQGNYSNIVYLPLESGTLALTSQVLTWKSQTIDMRNYDESYWHPVTVPLPYTGYNKIKVSVQLNIGDKPSWATHGSGFTCNMEIWATASGWGTTNEETICLNYTYAYCNSNPCGWKQLGWPSLGVLFLRGGSRYKVWTDFDATFTPHDKTYTWISGSYSQSTGGPYTSCPGLNFNKNIIYANLDGYASSAIKLQTPRSIWGQSFDGTGNVDGTLRIRNTTSNWCEGIRIQNGDNTWATIILGATSDYGTNANAWSIHRKSDNNFAISRNSSDGLNGLVMTSVGMGLGTAAPTQRLDVAGNIRTTGDLYISHSTNNDMSYNTSNPRIVFSENGSQAVGLVYTDYDSYRLSKGLKVMDVNNDDTSNVWFEVQGYNYSSGYVKNGSNDNYVLLGGGGHKLESALNVASASVASKVYGQVGDTGSHELVRCDMNNDQFRIIAGSNGNNNGWAEIATADDGSEPIYVRQYTGVFSSVRRTLTLLDGGGNTIFPGSLSIGGQIIREGHSAMWIYGRDAALLRETSAPGYHTLWSLKTTNGSWDFGEYNTSGWYNVPVLSYITDSNYNSGNNVTTYQIKFPLASGTVALTSYGGDNSHPIFLGYLNLEHGNDGTVSSSFYCLGYSVPFTYTRGGNYCRIYIPDTLYQTFYIRAAIASVNYSGGGMDTWVGDHRGEGAWWLHCYASGLNEVRVKGFCQRNSNNDSWWGGNPLWSGSSGANRITVCIFGNVTIR